MEDWIENVLGTSFSTSCFVYPSSSTDTRPLKTQVEHSEQTTLLPLDVRADTTGPSALTLLCLRVSARHCGANARERRILFVESCDGPARPKVTRRDILHWETVRECPVQLAEISVTYLSPHVLRLNKARRRPAWCSTLLAEQKKIGHVDFSFLEAEHNRSGPVPAFSAKALLSRFCFLSHCDAFKFLLTSPPLGSFIVLHTAPKTCGERESERLCLGTSIVPVFWL